VASSRNQKIHRDPQRTGTRDAKAAKSYWSSQSKFPFALSPALPGTARQGRCAAQVQVSFLRGSQRFARLMHMSGGNTILLSDMGPDGNPSPDAIRPILRDWN